jgi:flavorubredoxin
MDNVTVNPTQIAALINTIEVSYILLRHIEGDLHKVLTAHEEEIKRVFLNSRFEATQALKNLGFPMVGPGAEAIRKL